MKATSSLRNELRKSLEAGMSPFFNSCVSLITNRHPSKGRTAAFSRYIEAERAGNETVPEPAKKYPLTVIPTITYRDAATAMVWLCRTFGFTQHAVCTNSDGTIARAELTFGNGMIMLGSAEPEQYGMKEQATKIGLATMHSVNLIASDPDTIYVKAKTHGAEIIAEIMDRHYGGRGFSCRDLEGYLWHIDSCNPWKKSLE
jgi:uncharacterized glyoxalase superfamily protein PhnB